MFSEYFFFNNKSIMMFLTFFFFFLNKVNKSIMMFLTYFFLLLLILLHIYPPVTGQRQTLSVGRFAHFSLQLLLPGWRNPHLLRSFQCSQVPVNFFEFLSTEFAACSKPPSRDNHRKASYPRTQERDQSGVEHRSHDHGRR